MISRLLELVTDSGDGRLSNKKIGEIIVGATWTTYMWRAQPDSTEMWLAYAGALLGWSTVQYGLKKHHDRKARESDAPRLPAVGE